MRVKITEREKTDVVAVVTAAFLAFKAFGLSPLTQDQEMALLGFLVALVSAFIGR